MHNAGTERYYAELSLAQTSFHRQAGGWGGRVFIAHDIYIYIMSTPCFRLLVGTGELLVSIRAC